MCICWEQEKLQAPERRRAVRNGAESALSLGSGPGRLKEKTGRGADSTPPDSFWFTNTGEPGGTRPWPAELSGV